MLYYRRKYLLAIFELFGKQLSARMVQKILFLSTRGKDATKVYDFVPFKYGSYSFQANKDLENLCSNGYLRLISINGHTGYEHIYDGLLLQDLDIFDRKRLCDTRDALKDKTENEIIKFVYENYPFYAINSSIADDILDKQALEKIRNTKAKLHKEEAELFTIGYESLSLEAYLVKLLLKDVHVLCDVRKNAYSQKFGFSKAALRNGCEGVGINYIHISELGIESNKRQHLVTQEDYNLLFDEYEKTVLVQNADFLNIIIDELYENHRVALTCFEKNPLQCHRSRVAKAVKQKLKGNINFENII